MAIVLTCHLIETIWSKKDTGMRTPFMVIDHNGQQQQTEVMKAGAVTVWNTKATFPYAPSSDLVVMAFDAAGRQPGAFIAQAVVDVAVMLQEGSLSASAALVNRKGVNVGHVLFDVGLITSSRALAAGLDIPSLTFSTQTCPDSPTSHLNRAMSPANGLSSPFAQLAVQRGLAQQGAADVHPSTPSTAQSMGSKLVGSISSVLVGALLGLETRDRAEFEQHSSSTGMRSSGSSPRRLGTLSRSWDCSSTRPAGQQLQGSPQASKAADQQGSGSGGTSPAANASLARHRSLAQQGRRCSSSNDLRPSALLVRSSTSASTGAPSAPLAAERASFSAWGQPVPIAGPLTAGRPVVSAVSQAGGAAAAQSPPQRMAASADGCLARGNGGSSSSSTGCSASPQAAGASSMQQATPSRVEARRPRRLTVPTDGTSSGSSSPNPGSSRTLSPLTEARSRLRLARPQPLPPLTQLFPPHQREGLIPVGRAPASPGGYSEATTAGLSYGPEASADYDALLRDFDAADAAGKEAILFRELMLQQQERQTGSRQLLLALSQQQQKELLEHKQLMDALEGLTSESPTPTRAAAADAFRSCFSSSTQITSGGGSSSNNNSSAGGGSSGDTPFKHYPNLPEFATAAGAAAAGVSPHACTPPAAAAGGQQRLRGKQGQRGGSPPAGRPVAAAVQGSRSPTVQSPNRPAAGGLLQQLSSAEHEEAPLFSARQGRKLLGDRVGQQGSAQSSPMSAAAAAAAAAAEEEAAAVRQLNWQLLERMRQQELAAAAAAAPVDSYPISHAGTDISDGVSDADTPQDSCEAAAVRKAPRPAAVAPAYTCKRAPGQLPAYAACSSSSSSSSNDQAASKKGGSRWVAPARDAVQPYSKPPLAYPFVAVPVEPSAPLMTVPEEYPCA